jgi:hypothetical protein
MSPVFCHPCPRLLNHGNRPASPTQRIDFQQLSLNVKSPGWQMMLATAVAPRLAASIFNASLAMGRVGLVLFSPEQESPSTSAIIRKPGGGDPSINFTAEAARRISGDIIGGAVAQPQRARIKKAEHLRIRFPPIVIIGLSLVKMERPTHTGISQSHGPPSPSLPRPLSPSPSRSPTPTLLPATPNPRAAIFSCTLGPNGAKILRFWRYAGRCP